MKNYLMKRYKELSKKERKGFTLVELLVVIAILAVLASVSVVGYLGFVNKARESNAITEITQIREVVRDNLLDGAEHEYTWSTDKKATFKYSTTTSSSNTTYALSLKLTSAAANDKGSSILKGSFTDLNDLKGEIKVATGTTVANGTELIISTIAYKTTSGGYAQWTISDGSVANINETTWDTLNDLTFPSTN